MNLSSYPGRIQSALRRASAKHAIDANDLASILQPFLDIAAEMEKEILSMDKRISKLEKANQSQQPPSPKAE